ncbi:MAG TPA: TlyA family RNA methyltransferase, partial [Anaerolineae bacterium]|nr:TlyA family RNA methyltransferase [Anaerolineae bacterium]
MKKSVTKKRLDIILVERELVDSRQQAQGLIMAGQVMVDGRVVDKPGTRVPQEANVTLKATPPYVSRGGLKLEAALDRFAIEVTGVIAADVGASTGG